MRPIIIKRLTLTDGIERKSISVFGISVYVSERPAIRDESRRQIGFTIHSDIPTEDTDEDN